MVESRKKLWEIDQEVAQRIRGWEVETRAPGYDKTEIEVIVVDKKETRRYIRKPYWVEGKGSQLEFFNPTQNTQLCLDLVNEFAEQSGEHKDVFVDMLRAELEEPLKDSASAFDLVQATGRQRCLALLNAHTEMDNRPKVDEQDPSPRQFKCETEGCGEVIQFQGKTEPSRACVKCEKVSWKETEA